jgi:hypothetical protein
MSPKLVNEYDAFSDDESEGDDEEKAFDSERRL